MSPYFQRIKPSIRTRNVRFRSSGSNKCRAGRLALPRCFNAAYFNGKEKDYESGFHYYGTRYYWSEVLTGWLSVDPMMDKYPSISPYAYCVWNPVKLVDPDGKIVKDQNGNIVFCVTNANDAYIQSAKELPNGNRVYIYFEATKGKILTNNGTEITAYRANNSTIYAIEVTPNGEIVSRKTYEGNFDNSYNCTGNAFANQLFTISSTQIDASFLQSEGYSALEDNQPPCSGDIGIYSSEFYEHFEVFLTPNSVSTKGGIQEDPGPSDPGRHPHFSNGRNYSIWRRHGQDRTVTIPQKSSSVTSPGVNTVNSETFETIKQSLE